LTVTVTRPPFVELEKLSGVTRGILIRGEPPGVHATVMRRSRRVVALACPLNRAKSSVF
jgi:hypothetical protein